MSELEKALSWIDKSNSQAISLLKEIVEINSFTYNLQGIGKIHTILYDYLTALGLSARRINQDELGEVLVATTAASSAPCLLIGHTDTVHPPESDFQKFSMHNTRAYGPGVLDMKGGLIVILWALKALHTIGRLNEIPIKIVINSDEEISSQASEETLKAQGSDAKCALVFEWGREHNYIITRRKGMGIYEIEVHGKTAHSGNNHAEGANAIEQLAHLILAVQGITDYNTGVTCNVGLVSGGVATNSVPDVAKAKFDLRVPSVEAYQKFKRDLEKLKEEVPKVPGTSFEIRELTFSAPMQETEQSRTLAKSYIDAGRLVGVRSAIHPQVLGGGSDGNLYSSLGVPTIDGLGPYGEYPHSKKEYIQIPSLVEKTKNLVAWLLKYGATKS